MCQVEFSSRFVWMQGGESFSGCDRDCSHHSSTLPRVSEHAADTYKPHWLLLHSFPCTPAASQMSKLGTHEHQLKSNCCSPGSSTQAPPAPASTEVHWKIKMDCPRSSRAMGNVPALCSQWCCRWCHCARRISRAKGEAESFKSGCWGVFDHPDNYFLSLHRFIFLSFG